MIDTPGRLIPRFPGEKEKIVQKALYEKLKKIKTEQGKQIRGIAGGASGGDILFHEACRALNIPTELYLGSPYDLFLKSSVEPSGQNWVVRFNELYKTIPVVIFKDEVSLFNDYSSPEHWEEVNSWMLEAALKNGNSEVTLLALWDGIRGDGSGGTDHMVNMARFFNINLEIINPLS